MLQLFRKYQRYLYILITTVIVISFSFFGTYGTLSDGSFREQVAFTTIDGTDITRHELDEMVQFLATDNEDKVLFGGMWGPNFLNDGVIKKNFIETGLGFVLAEAYIDQIAPDLASRHDKEQRYSLYSHPQAQFINVEGAWNYFSPNMKEYYTALRNSSDPTSTQALRSRMALFIMERQFPPSLLRQVLRYQESQHSYIKPDPNLNYIDLSLFGYHTFEDWFGPRFTRLIAEFIINTAAIAEQRGYEVSRTEALADLKRNAEISYQQNLKSSHLAVKDSHEYFQEQLRRLGMDQNMAAKVWQKVLLFRRLFQDLGSSMFVDPASFHGLNEYSLEALDGTVYTVPNDLQINSYRTLQKFEVYLDAIAKRSDDERTKLAMPTSFLSAADITKKNPDLVEKKYLLEVAEINKKNLEASISLKDTWAYETSNEGWKKIQTHFADLKLNANATAQERFTALESMDEKTRQGVDAYARDSIIESHPEMIANALKQASASQKIVGLTEAKAATGFAGVNSGKKLIELLDAAPVNKAAASTDAEKAAIAALSSFTGDNNTYYSITVIERAPKAQILTFAQANSKGILDAMLDKQLEEHYTKIREATPGEFQTASKAWKPFADVKDTVADKYFDKVLKGLKTAYATAIAPEKPPEKVLNDLAATYRLYPYMRDMQQKLSKDPALSDSLAKDTAGETQPESIKENAPLADQWKLVKSNTQITKSSGDIGSNKDALFALTPGQFSAVTAQANGNVSFFQVKQRGNQTSDLSKAASVLQTRRLLADGAQHKLMQQLLTEMKDKKAISLEYLDKSSASESADETPAQENTYG
jgi:GcvH upstream region-like protein